MRTLAKLFLMAVLATPAYAQYAPVVWPGQGWPAPWPQFVWVPVVPPYFMWPVPQWPAMPLPYPAEALTWPAQPLPSPSFPDVAAGSHMSGIAATPDATASAPASNVLPDAPKAETARALTEMPANPPSASVQSAIVPTAQKAFEAIKAKPKPKAKRPAVVTVKPKAKPRRLCWNNGVVDACPK